MSAGEEEAMKDEAAEGGEDNDEEADEMES